MHRWGGATSRLGLWGKRRWIHVPKPGAAFASFWGLSTVPLKNVEQLGRYKEFLESLPEN